MILLFESVSDQSNNSIMLQFVYCTFLLLFLLTYNQANKATPFTFNVSLIPKTNLINNNGTIQFQQNDYVCKPEHVDVLSYDKTFIQYLKVVTFKYNRTCTAFNLSVNYKIDFGNKMEVKRFETFKGSLHFLR